MIRDAFLNSFELLFDDFVVAEEVAELSLLLSSPQLYDVDT